MLKSFRSDRQGGVAILFALAAIPLTVATGASVDYSLVAQQKVHLQDAVDASALAGAILNSLADGGRIAEAERIFAANFPDHYFVQPTISIDLDTVTVSASLPAPMAFMGIIGIDNIQITASATAIKSEGSPVCMLALNPNQSGGVRIETATRRGN